MGWTGTLATLAVTVSLGIWARAGVARPSEPGRVRYIPYTMILFVSALAATLLMGQIIRLSVAP